MRRVDAYLENPALLAGKPKLTIGNYVESEGELVARRFQDLDEARASGKDFIIRSELTEEYDGPSGLLDSWPIMIASIPQEQAYARSVVADGPLDIRQVPSEAFVGTRASSFLYAQALTTGQEDLEAQLKAYEFDLTDAVGDYFTKTGRDPERMREEVAYSYWEFIPGYNRAVIADSAIPGRHHILTHGTEVCSHVIFEQDTMIYESSGSLPAQLAKRVPELLATYERIRRLKRFDPNHCPLMEFQTSDDMMHDYFLQYHRTRDLRPATFMLDRAPRAAEKEAMLVRGATDEAGLTVECIVGYDDMTPRPCMRGFFDTLIPGLLREKIVRQLQAQMLTRHKEPGHFSHNLISHATRSLFFKPDVSVVIHRDTLGISLGEIKQLQLRALREGTLTSIPIHITSDGRKCYVKRAG